jgi:membrane protease subunit HflK
MLTGDTNLIEVGLNIHYTVADAGSYLFNVDRPEDLVAREAEAAVRQAVARRPVEGLLTEGREEIVEDATTRLQKSLDGHSAGVRVTGVNLLEVRPPASVAAAFRDVASAREDKATYVNEAGAYRNEIVPVARGDAGKAREQARAERRSKTNRATGEAQRFAARAEAFLEAPEVTRTRLYLEAMERVLPPVKKYLLSPEVKVDSTDLWFAAGAKASQQE